MYQMIIYHLVVIVNMMTVETLIVKLGVNPKEISKAEIILLTSLVERYNHGYMRRSIYFSYEEVLIKEAEGIIHGYLPEIDGIIYEDQLMTIEELMNKLGLTEVSKVDRQLLDHLLHLYNTGQLKVVSISREEALLQMADAYLNNCLPQIDDIIYRD